ncbi:uncharacterized protein STEHIDRAFT_116772 [Stereum hirsutum FP-91666 SS1]|uniref:Uncharacterized protein n=1 Tax=Stereum hirsutum (strain FP-91666) TaxID=721885 RepID=R7RXP9_STEHR|nr:uncharacterized protein STEHIDRAFT_116772 [Stereum hirsutum FP-91666 SS1]EIM79147.1 hypothetical protein STEHIDRAFT_116772 [Stereum hirsutum FP-91666 SS1]
MYALQAGMTSATTTGHVPDHGLPPQSTVLCCDICCPELLDRTRPGLRKQNGAAQKIPFEKESCRDLEDALDEWREEVFEHDAPDSYLTPSSILPDEAVEKLARLSQPIQEDHIRGYLSRRGPLWSRYGKDLTRVLLYVDRITAVPSNPTAPATPPVSEADSRKRVQEPADDPQAKRRRTAQDIAVVHAERLDNDTTQASSDPHSHFEPASQMHAQQSADPPAGTAIRTHYRPHTTETSIIPPSSTSSYYRPSTAQYATAIIDGGDSRSTSDNHPHGVAPTTTSSNHHPPALHNATPPTTVHHQNAPNQPYPSRHGLSGPWTGYHLPAQASSSVANESTATSLPARQAPAHHTHTAAPAVWTPAYAQYYYQVQAHAQAQAHAHAQYLAYLAHCAASSSHATPSNTTPSNPHTPQNQNSPSAP